MSSDEETLPIEGGSRLRHGPLVGRRLGRVRLEAVLGSGAYAVVYLGELEGHDLPVAVKVLAALRDADDHLAARFLREARVVAALDDPHVVGLHEAGETAEGLLYLVMEYVPGGSLADELAQRGRLPWPDAARRARDAARGLAAAWARRIVHRDIKPANLLLDGEQRLKLADLGLAKPLGVGETMTASAARLGTMAYMSPEQITAPARVDIRTDLYALGVTLYQMIDGQRPFTGSAFELARAHVEGVRPTVQTEVPFALGALARELIDADPLKRPETPDEVVARLEAILG